jgi:hypothetical protein
MQWITISISADFCSNTKAEIFVSPDFFRLSAALQIFQISQTAQTTQISSRKFTYRLPMETGPGLLLLINDNVELMCRLALLRLGFDRLLDKLAQRIERQSHAMTEIVTAAHLDFESPA